MGSTELRKNGSNLKKMTDKERAFCLEYMVDYQGTRSVIAAGYSKKGASVMAIKLLKRSHIKAYLGKAQRLQREERKVDSDEILDHLVSCVTRDGKDFVDEHGKLRVNMNELPDNVTRAVDGIKQKRKVYTYEDGTTVEEIETELKLVPKAAALDMAMKHKGLFAPEEHKVLSTTVDWDKLLEAGERGNGYVDPIEARIEAEGNIHKTLQ